MSSLFLTAAVLLCFLCRAFGDTTSALSRAVKTADNRQPAIPRPEQDAAAQAKLAAVRAAHKGKRPNIVWLIIDDLGYGDMGGPYGGGETIGAATPHMNALASGGLVLKATYSQPTCTPTRAAMLLGRLPTRTGLTRPALAGDELCVQPWAGETSVAEILSRHGYHTVHSGKWHQGEDEEQRPCDVGFHECLTYYTTSKDITQTFDERKYPDLFHGGDRLAGFQAMGSKIHLYRHNVHDMEVIAEETTSIDVFRESDQHLAEFTIAAIEQLSLGDKPFFISHNFMRVHQDNFPSDAFRGQSASKYPFKDCVVEVDDIVGRIMKALEDALVADNTFVFLTSDNGPEADAWPDAGYTPFRGAKSTTWEGGVRVPGIAYWKGVIKPRVSSELFDLMDLYNVAVNLAGAELDDELPALGEDGDVYIDGIDQTSFLIADDGESLREHVYMYAEHSFNAIRMREYKMHMYASQAQSVWQQIDYSAQVTTGLAKWMFNLYIDPGEKMPVGYSRSPWVPVISQEYGLHKATFTNYSVKDIGLTLGTVCGDGDGGRLPIGGNWRKKEL